MKSILLLATGGTIASSDFGDGLRPHFDVDDLLHSIEKTGGKHRVNGKTIMNIDSSNMNPECWLRIAREILLEYNSYDGFVITHGTDTMAYSGAALTYLLEGLDKPVVLTGSQYSMADSRTDALQNLNDSLLLAEEDVAGVFIVFDGKVINGTRGMKTKTRSYDAFESINYPVIATIKHNRINYNPSVLPTFSKEGRDSEGMQKLQLIPALEDRLMIVKMFPGFHPGVFDYIQNRFKAVIIESYGIGGLATGSPEFCEKIISLVEGGVLVAITTQCLKEGVDFNLYEVGRKLPLEKIIFTRDMNTEALVAKLMWAMARGEDFGQIKQLVETPVQDDLSLEVNDQI